jgi:hypothetical protein
VPDALRFKRCTSACRPKIDPPSTEFRLKRRLLSMSRNDGAYGRCGTGVAEKDPFRLSSTLMSRRRGRIPSETNRAGNVLGILWKLFSSRDCPTIQSCRIVPPARSRYSPFRCRAARFFSRSACLEVRNSVAISQSCTLIAGTASPRGAARVSTTSNQYFSPL